jgi:hypothetical protein
LLHNPLRNQLQHNQLLRKNLKHPVLLSDCGAVCSAGLRKKKLAEKVLLVEKILLLAEQAMLVERVVLLVWRVVPEQVVVLQAVAIEEMIEEMKVVQDQE